MSVIVELEVGSDEFELGRILSVPQGTRIELERLVPAGGKSVPLLWLYDGVGERFAEEVRTHATVADIECIDSFADRSLYALEWDAASDDVLAAITRQDGHLVGATGHHRTWQIEVRFPSHDALSQFKTLLAEADVDYEVHSIYNPTRPDAGPWFGLTESQREALTMAVEKGYYEIPRTCTTVELAEALGISDQAVTERLRRAIVNLVANTLLASPERDED